MCLLGRAWVLMAWVRVRVPLYTCFSVRGWVLVAAVGDFAVRAGRAARSRRVRVALRVG